MIGRIDNASANLIDAAEVGHEHGATGYLITDWGDNGHLQPPSVSFGPLLLGGAVSWSLAANRDLDVAAALDRHVFLDANRALGGALDELGRVWRATGQRAFNASPLQVALAPHQLHLVVGRPDPVKVRGVVDRIDGALAAIDGSAPACIDGDLVRDELRTAARLARHGALPAARRRRPCRPGGGDRCAGALLAGAEPTWRPGGQPRPPAPLLGRYPYDEKPG